VPKRDAVADHWELAKHVLAHRALPPDCDPRADRVTALLDAIARGLRAEDAAEVERLASRALREFPDRFVATAFLAPRMLTDAKRAAETEALLLDCGPQARPDRRAFAAALLSSALAQQARRAASARYAAQAVEALEDVDDDLLTAHVEARLAESATWRGDIAELLVLAERSTERFERHGHFAQAASVLTMQLLPRYENGDLDGAKTLIDRVDACARRAGNVRMVAVASTLRLLHAAMSGDEAALGADNASPVGQSAYDRCILLVYTAHPHAWHGRWHDFIARVERAEPVTVAQRALVDATLAVGAAATRDDARARVLWRRAVHRLAGGPTWHLSDTRVRRMARALACAAGAAIGDVARAHRAAVPLRGTRQLAVFTGSPEPTLAGQVRIVTRMREARMRSEPAVVLTPAQAAILKTLVTDASIAEIARNDPERRSIATIRSHVQQLYGVLGVHSRTGAVMKAKELALL